MKYSAMSGCCGCESSGGNAYFVGAELIDTTLLMTRENGEAVKFDLSNLAGGAADLYMDGTVLVVVNAKGEEIDRVDLSRFVDVVPDATTTQKGVVELATAAEAKQGTSATLVLTPATAKELVLLLLSNPDNLPIATTEAKGVAELATADEAKAGTADDVVVTPAGLKAALDDKVKDATTTQKGIVELATNAEAKTGTATNLAVTPAGLKAALDAQADTGLRLVNTSGEVVLGNIFPTN